MRKNILIFTKKFLLCFIVLVTIFNLSACSTNSTPTSNNNNNSQITNTNKPSDNNNNSNSNNNQGNNNNNSGDSENNIQNNTPSNSNPYDVSANYTLTFANQFPLNLEEKVYHANGVLLRNNKIEISKVDYKIESYTYSNSINISLSVTAKKTYASGYMNYKSIDVDYKIYDEDGVTIQDGTISISSDIGEIVRAEKTISIWYNASPKPEKHNYKIELYM